VAAVNERLPAEGNSVVLSDGCADVNVNADETGRRLPLVEITGVAAVIVRLAAAG
jgi:hypothetical protein